MNSMKLVIPWHSLYWSIHIKDESKHGSTFAPLFKGDQSAANIIKISQNDYVLAFCPKYVLQTSSENKRNLVWKGYKKKKNRKKGYDRKNFRTEPYPVPLLSLPLGVQFNRQHFQNTLNQWNSQGNCQWNNQWNNQGNDGLAKLRYPNSEYHTVELHKGRETLAHHASEPRVPEFLRVKENSQSFDNRAFGQPGTRRVSFLDEHWITQHCDPRSLGRTSHTPHR